MRLGWSAVSASASGHAASGGARARPLVLMWALALAVIAGLAACGTSDATEADLERLELAFERADVALGSEVFDDSCSVCHGSDGSGGVGAALGGVDERLSVRNHLSVVWAGRGSMPPFGGILADAEIAAVVAYQRSTFGTE
ncbi:c-type cytochrome [Candidatus Poriferisodalis sp.]|uniref:c-type cytochrome n=1 Tax=Candidatus Poriferisodalis sp. TaxID=3101277 RepID=UPI003B02E529